MAKSKLFEPKVGWNPEPVSITSPGIDRRLRKWHRTSAPAAISKYTVHGSAARVMATIHTGIWNAFKDYMAVLGRKGDEEKVALGMCSFDRLDEEGKPVTGKLYMAEVELEDGTRQAAVFNTLTRKIEAANITPTRTISYVLTEGSLECGRVVFLSLFPELLEDEEAREAFEKIAAFYEADDLENEDAGHAIAKLSDNIYRRINLDTFKVNIPTSCRLKEIDTIKIKTGAYSPTTIIGGTFKFFASSGKAPVKKGVTIKEAKEMFKSFNEDREWSEEEKKLIELTTSRISEDDIVEEKVLRMARYITGSSDFQNPIRNFLWRGETGFGKSYGCEQLAAVLGMPLLRINCFPEMTTNDFLSQFVPANSYENDEVPSSPAIEFPSFEEILYDPEAAYKKMTGKYEAGISSEACLDVFVQMKVKQAASQVEKDNSTPRFKMVKSDYVSALEKGYIIEVQEPSLIEKPGVLGGLNEYDRPGSIVRLVDGSRIIRHKNAIVVFTYNVNYEGCRALNESVIRRSFAGLDSYNMSKEETIERVKKMSGLEDYDLLDQMYEVWASIKEYCKDKGITGNGGVVSIVELANWAQGVRIMGVEDIRSVCIETVVGKATPIIEEQEDIIAACVDTVWLS